MHAQEAYLFRHALMRDAAYEMQLPRDRGQLHKLSFLVMEQEFGGCPAALPSPVAFELKKFKPHPTGDRGSQGIRPNPG